MALALAGVTGATLGLIDGTVKRAVSKEYHIQGFPTIIVFPGGGKPTTTNDVMMYRGGRTNQEIVDFA